MKLRRNCEPLQEEDIPTCHGETSHLESLSIKTILFPKFILWLCLQWSTDLGHSTVNRSCASLNYLIAPISNSQFAYALFTQNTKNASNTFIEPLHSRNFLLRIPTPEENFSACLNISLRKTLAAKHVPAFPLQVFPVQKVSLWLVSRLSDGDTVEESDYTAKWTRQKEAKPPNCQACWQSTPLYAQWAGSQSKVHHVTQAMKQLRKEKDQ